MTLSTITVNGQPVELLTLPPYPVSRMVEPWISDPVAESVSPWTGATQTQRFPGGDAWGLTVTMPPIARQYQGAWIAWLMGMRGKQRAVQMPDPTWQPILSSLTGSVPVVDSSVSTNNVAGSVSLVTRGWKPGATVLQAGEQFQVGYRLYRVVLTVTSDSTGAATFEVFPGLREQPPDGTPLVFTSSNPGINRQRGPLGLFRLAENKRNWSLDVTRLMRLSFQLKEFR